MKRLSLALAVLGLAAGLALALDNVSPVDRDTQRGAVKTTEIDDAQTDRAVDRTTDRNMIEDRDLNASKGTGVATGFVAAGIGLALLGLFVGRRNRRYGHYHDDDATRGSGLPPRV